MGTYTGTNGDDIVAPAGLSPGVVADPPGTVPGDGPDTLIGGDGNDRLDGGASGDKLEGNWGDDWLIGGSGRDWLRGGNGADTMEGGSGDDVYFVDDLHDTTVETTADASGGSDAVRASVSYTLSFGIELLKQEGFEEINGTGNALDNVFYGSRGANVLRGAGGNDELYGNGGDDELLGGSGNDIFGGGTGKDWFRAVGATTSSG